MSGYMSFGHQWALYWIGDAMAQKKKVILPLIFFLSMVGYFAVSNKLGNEQDGEFQISLVEERNFEIQVTTIGVLDTSRSHMLSSEIRSDDAKIIFIVEDGKHVNSGEVLVGIDPTPFEERIHKLESEVKAIESGLQAKSQILEWEKNQLEKNINAVKFNLKVSELELERLINGEGPLQLNQYVVEVNKIKKEYEKFIIYRRDLGKLKEGGFENESEIEQADDQIEELKEKFEAARNKLTSYRDHVFPLSVKSAEAKLEKARSDILQTRNGGVFKIAKAVADVQETKSRLHSKKTELKQAENELEKTQLRAPFKGIAILYEAYRDGEKRKPRIGDRVIRNQPILYLPDISSMVVNTNIREIDLNKVSLGQEATISVDAYPDAKLLGNVNFIGALASEIHGQGVGGKYFKVSVDVATEDMRLRPGMTARIHILSEKIKDALTIPIASVFKEKNTTFCYKFDGERFFRKELKIGRQNFDFVQVLSGLEKGDKVSLVRPYDSEHEISAQAGG